MTRLRPFAPLLLAATLGCGSPNPPPPPGEPVAVVPGIAAPTEPQPDKPAAEPPPKPQPSEPPAELPDDLGGKAVAKVLATPGAAATDVPKPSQPTPHTSALDRGELPLPGVTPRPFAPTATAGKPASPTAPRDRNLLAPLPYPDGLPSGKADDRPLLKAASPLNPGAADVPGVSAQRPDRAPLEDPTTDLSAGRVIATPLPVPTAALPFLRLGIPDPFEWVEQLKGKLGREPEFGKAVPK